MQRRNILYPLAFILPVLLIALAACGDDNGNGDDAGPGAAPTETPDERDDGTDDQGNDAPAFEHELVATEKTLPPESFETILRLAESQVEYEELWAEFQFDDEAPPVDWGSEVVIFVGTGESGTCPLNLMGVEYDADEHLVTIEVSEDLDEDTPCTDDWTPRAFVVAVSNDVVEDDELNVSLYHSGYSEREIHREQVLGVNGSDDPAETPTPQEPASGDWWEQLLSEKEYPEDEIGEEVFALAEDEDQFAEQFDRFQLMHDVGDIDFETHVVLFAGTGESSGCPLLLNEIEFLEDERVILIDAAQEDPDAMCTADWTPRVFVVALERDHLGDGELRAMFDRPDLEEIGPDDGVVVREE